MSYLKKSVWMFPGQGAQTHESLKDIPYDYYDLIKNITGLDFFESPPDFSQTRDIQLILLLVEVYYAEKLKSESIEPDYVAGHSLGAFSAAVIAQVIDLKTAIKLVYHRGSLMQSLYPIGYGMGVVNGLTRYELEKITKHYFVSDKPAYVSNQNEELQLTISGNWETIDLILKSAKEEGAGLAKRLNVPTPSHSPLMQEVVDVLEKKAKDLTFNKPLYPYFSNCTGRLLVNAEEIKVDLINNVIYPVRWIDMMQGAVENGGEIFIELPPGRTLTKLFQRAYPKISVFSVDQYGVKDTAFLYKKWSKNND